MQGLNSSVVDTVGSSRMVVCAGMYVLYCTAT